MTTQPARLWTAVLLVGWTFDLLFWNSSIGLNYPIFLLITLIGGLSLLLSFGLKPSWKSLLLLLPTGFFAVMTVLRQEPLSLFLAYAVSVACLGLFAVSYLSGGWWQFGPLDAFLHYLILAGSLVVRPLLFAAESRKERAQIHAPSPRQKFPFGPVVRGILIALPILAVFASLLASADPIFNQSIGRILDIFKIEKLRELATRLFLILVIAYLLAGIYLHAATQSKTRRPAGVNWEARPFLGFIETAIILGSLTALFLLFVIIQFRYFFGGSANIGVEGYTFSEYARRGFTELVVVAGLSLLLILGLNLFARRENPAQKRLYSALSVLLAVEVLIILVAAYHRLNLAIDWHGLSRLRIYPRVFMLWLAALFVGIVLLEIVNRQRFFTLAVVIAGLGFCVNLSLVNVDALIVRHNVMRAAQGRHFNVGLLSALSADAVPALTRAFSDPSLTTEIHEGIGAALRCHQYSAAYSRTDEWRSYNHAVNQASRALDQIDSELQEYQVNDDEYLIRVGTPGGEWFECLPDPCADSSYCD